LRNTSYTEFDFREDSATEIRLYEANMEWDAVYGSDPLDLIQGFTEFAGRMPPPPDWTQSGAVVALARPLDDSLALVDELIDAGVRVAGVWNQTWSGINVTFIGEQVLWNWVLDEEEHPGWHDWVSNLADRDVRTLCYINSMFLDLSDRETIPERHLFAEGEAGGYFVKDEHGETLLLPVTAFDVALLDFTNEEARTWMKSVIIDEMVEGAGCSGWMVDFAEALPFEAVLHDGTSASEYHNRYPVEWMRLNREAIEEAGLLGEVLTFNRSGHTQSPGESLMFWEGDQLTTWDKYDGMTSALRGLLNGGFSGLALNHSDTGGYTSLSRFGLGYSREAEQLKRWSEMSAFTSLLRTHEGNQPEANAQVYDDDQKEQFAWASRVFAGLKDYRSLRFAEAESMGWPVVRHMWLHYPDDETAHETDDQFMLGSSILVAPILEKCGLWAWCVSERDVYLPEGEWTHLWTGDIVEGPASLRLESPLQQPPVFYRNDDPEAHEAVETLRSFDVGVHAE
jgi:alpha-glucosidase